MSALSKARAAIKEARTAASKRYSKMRETEHGRLMTHELTSSVGSIAAGAMIGSMPEQSVSVWGVDIPYAGVAGLAAYVGGRYAKSDMVRSAGHGLLTGTLTVMAYESAQGWAAAPAHS